MNKAHKHAAVIHAWADGAEIECQSELGGQWHPYGQGDFSGRGEYRVKPEPPTKVYPVSRMTAEEINSAWQGPCGFELKHLVWLANAALRHAIDSGQLVTMADANFICASHNLARDMAIAEAVRQVAKACACPVTSPEVFMRIDKLDLAAILASVKD